MLRTKALSEDRGLHSEPEAFFYLTYSYDLLVCFGFFCAFLTLSSFLFTEVHFFPNNLRMKSEVLDHLIVLPDALCCSVRLLSFSVHKPRGM